MVRIISAAAVAIGLLLADPSSARATTREEPASFPFLSDNSPEAWPAPNATGGHAWPDALTRAHALVAQMTLKEKANFLRGQNGPCAGNTAAIERLHIPSLCLKDGPAGVRPATGVSQFPAGQAVAATFDKGLIYKRAYAMGREFHDQGVNIALAPVTGGPLGRSPLAGRNWEGFFADAYATGIASYESVKGMQDAGTIATAKHWIAYEQETYRHPNIVNSSRVDPGQLPVSSNVDDRATHELYMWGFAEAVRAGAGYVMCSYNQVNQTYACANAYSQNHLLKGELNFQGAIVSDWGAVWGNAPFINGGLDLSMSGIGSDARYWGDILVQCVNNGSVSEARLDDAATRILTPWIAFGQADTPLLDVSFSTNVTNNPPDVRQSGTADLIRKIGEDSATLLKNTRGALPLRKLKKLAIVGSDAGPNALSTLNSGGAGGFGGVGGLDGNTGTLTLGGGSGWAIAPYIVTPYEAINYRGRKSGAQVYAIFDNTALDKVSATVRGADTALVFVRAFSVEGKDRPNLKLDSDGENLIKTVAQSNKNTIVVMHTGAPVLVEDWINHENVTAVIAAHYPGQESGDAIANVLFGDVSPSGRMPYTTGKSLEDWPPNTITSEHVAAPQAYFNESTLIDYRWFSAKNITPRFEFGFGLSYSTFEYSNIAVRKTNKADTSSIQRTKESFEGSNGSNSLYDVVAEVSADVKNVGAVEASEVPQLYASFPGSEGIWLRGFDKLKLLKPGEKRTTKFALRRKDLSLWSTERQLWYIPDGEVTLQVGASSTKLHLKTTWSK